MTLDDLIHRLQQFKSDHPDMGKSIIVDDQEMEVVGVYLTKTAVHGQCIVVSGDD
jgi:hypothetical protein